MKSLGDRKTLDKSEIKILKSKIPNGILRHSRKKQYEKKRKRIIFEDFSAACDL